MEIGRTDRCGATGKERFKTKDAARAYTAGYARAKGTGKVYMCVFCNGYHTTKNARQGGKRSR